MSTGADSGARAEVRHAAHRAEANPVFETIARAGFVADGIVHVLIGVLAVVVAFGGDGETDQSGALLTIAGAPLGFVVLWLAALALTALGVWQLLDGILVRRESAAQKWGARLIEWAKAAVFFALALVAAAVAVGARPDPDGSVQDASRGVLFVPGGPIVLGLIGVAVGAGGVGFAVVGIRRRFVRLLSLPSGRAGAVVTGIAVFGYIAKGLALVTVGVLLVVAAVKVDPEDAGGLDAALDGLIALPLGPAVCGAIGGGLIAYGVYLVLSARYRRL
ncbi:DUF1206 domain-containing protein [Microbacterium sp. NEAU-LLC]|uniref:DUF1206 domain-containing protein n=1 Tax=Microbacterium helvum TaxID=2773713 RepID=A0ABR8NRZ6_9MICO|nr:DUF1206 domain-containing protein [Microbacterium helvum]MBD3943407.1 DUF1206 domain-containing protein [Microbacterium helvum]